ncbi:MAG: hypothetical protein KME21_31925 [Desmonostoc vinosum HA7617-LM4]|jgi:hypothetical protein|nr:hypothetical protein [Desmonostoc vinosum HA7617-LM4]
MTQHISYSLPPNLSGIAQLQAAFAMLEQENVDDTKFKLLAAIASSIFFLLSFGHLGYQFVFIEHYPYHNRPGWDDKEETFCLVQLNWNNQRFQQPRWSPLKPEAVLAWINQPTYSDNRAIA